MSKELQDDLIFVGYTNGAQVLYANDSNFGSQGAFFKTSDHNSIIPLYMLKTHAHRLETTTEREVTLERIKAAQDAQHNLSKAIEAFVDENEPKAHEAAK